jgi:DNA-binding CsgD family transcriptional regulator
VNVLRGQFKPADVQAAAAGLQTAGLSWEASRLTGQAAIRSDDAAVTRSLLEQARDLKTALPLTELGAVPSSALSEREQEVASHIADGLTYKEIGALLFISPKTVEHHVAKVRQKLGATTRAEMLAALRDYLDR